jgi:molybdopterin-guanine dinucleotide biosynthesis protein A
MSQASPSRQDITGLILAGGRGTRMGGVDKGLQEARTAYVLTVPCDSPRFPLDLAARLALALEPQHAEIAMVSAPEMSSSGATVLRPQPVFCLLSTRLLPSLQRYLAAGERKIDRWTALHRTVLVPFDQAQDDPAAFANINTLTDLHDLPAAP